MKYRVNYFGSRENEQFSREGYLIRKYPLSIKGVQRILNKGIKNKIIIDRIDIWRIEK